MRCFGIGSKHTSFQEAIAQRLLSGQEPTSSELGAPHGVGTGAPAVVVVGVDLIVRADVLIAEGNRLGTERVELEGDLRVVHHVAVLDGGGLEPTSETQSGVF